MGLISRVSSRTYRFDLFFLIKMFRSALRYMKKAPLANGPLQAPTNLNQLHARNYARVQSKSWIGAMTVGLIWLWMVRIPNSEITMDYVKHIDLNERRDLCETGVSSQLIQQTGKKLISPNSVVMMKTKMTNKSHKNNNSI